ncbi:hypothetical protein DJ66_1014 [Candidatus Liberibacter solanacearum]|uniref:Uncharacterized protein n=1 Tax=Candidatus Liberibacter solanacearum TaxID=556287 RepID=A0A0F4VLK1_9HYPH|nr:hypothetical protein DJ66_1014 [Candidatus Liberibacter solanacearum]
MSCLLEYMTTLIVPNDKSTANNKVVSEAKQGIFKNKKKI